MVERAHRIADVCRHGRPGGDRLAGLLEGGIGVTDRGDDARRPEPGDGGERTVALGSDRHHPQSPPGSVDKLIDDLGGGIGHELRVLGTAAGGGQERPFGVNSGDVAAQRRASLVEQPADPPGRCDEVAGRRRHQAEQRRRRPVTEMELHATDDGVGVAGSEAVPATAVDVDIHESGDDRPARHAGRARRGAPLTDGDDALAGCLHPAGDDTRRPDDATGDQH